MVLAIFFSDKIGFPILPRSLTSFLCFLRISNNNFAVVDLPLVPVIVIFKLDKGMKKGNTVLSLLDKLDEERKIKEENRLRKQMKEYEFQDEIRIAKMRSQDLKKLFL